MQRRGRPSTQPPKLRDGFYIELRAHGLVLLRLFEKHGRG